MEPYQDEPLLSVVGVVAEGVDWISESSESAGENEIEIVASTSTVLADNGERCQYLVMIKHLLLLSLACQFVLSCRRRVCYHTNWSQYRRSGGQFYPENIQTSLCTHLIYAFATVDGNRLKHHGQNDLTTTSEKGMYERFNDLKKNSSVKTLLAVGEYSLGFALFTRMVATNESRQEFADHAVTFLKKHKFDGLDLDWTGSNLSPLEDKGKFTLLVKQLRETFQKDAELNGGSPLLLTATVSVVARTIASSYDIPKIAKELDFLNLKSYDFHGSWERFTGHHSALYAHPEDHDPQLNVDFAAQLWVRKGCPADKLVIGIPTFARTFKLALPSYAPAWRLQASGGGAKGFYTHQVGLLAYYEVCGMLQNADDIRRFEAQKVPYLMKGGQWIGYDDIQSVKEKTRYAVTNGYGGVMTWALPMDDFSGEFCGQGKYPLWSAVNEECQAQNFTLEH